MALSNFQYGNLFLVGLSGPTLSDLDKRILAEVKPVGILLFERNFLKAAPYKTWLPALEKLLYEVRQYAEREEMIISIDHEGGKIQVAPPPITNFGPPAGYARHAPEVAKAMAVEIASLGANLSWAPLADINSNPKSPIIGQLGRAFATTPQGTAEIAVEFMRALTEAGIAGCAKHFPGHGHTFSDSHLELPFLDLEMKDIAARELIPFQALIDIGIPFVMTAHIMFPKIDAHYPATLSKIFLTDLLRSRMEFKGVCVADNIGMEAVVKMFKDEEAISTAINAGVDLTIVSRHEEPFHDDTPLQLAHFIERGLAQRRVSEQRLREAGDRVEAALRTKLTQHKVSVLDEEVWERHQELRREIVRE